MTRVTKTGILTPAERADYGVIVIARRRDGTGRAEIISVPTGGSSAALREACKRVDALEGDWYVDTISNPNTIYSDLKGRTDERNRAVLPESHLLARIDRSDLSPLYSNRKRARDQGRSAV